MAVGGYTSGLWVFGYGSLCWNPGFEFEQSCIGFIRGYRRRFSQGNTHHRGTRDKPGRVATLVDDKEGNVWGRAYLITGEAALSYLAERECKIGGYKTVFTPVYTIPEVDPETSTDVYEQITTAAIVYIATPDNEHWLGDAKITTLADEICNTAGKNGHNIDYILNLAKFIREHCPYDSDYHLFELENEIMRQKPEHKCQFYEKIEINREDAAARREVQQHYGEAAGLQFSTRVPNKKLRCLNI